MPQRRGQPQLDVRSADRSWFKAKVRSAGNRRFTVHSLWANGSVGKTDWVLISRTARDRDARSVSYLSANFSRRALVNGSARATNCLMSLIRSSIRHEYQKGNQNNNY
jgi:hypothetical protein